MPPIDGEAAHLEELGQTTGGVVLAAVDRSSWKWSSEMRAPGDDLTNVFPRVSYTPDDHFGGTGVHVLKADCGARIHRDGGTFKSSF